MTLAIDIFDGHGLSNEITAKEVQGNAVLRTYVLRMSQNREITVHHFLMGRNIERFTSLKHFTKNLLNFICLYVFYVMMSRTSLMILYRWSCY